jgi:hypothetical protein
MTWRRVSNADLAFLSMSAETPYTHSHASPQSDEENERLALAAGEAIKSLVAERKLLRLEVLRLREHVKVIRNSYHKLANELIAQLQLIDSLEKDRPANEGLLEFPKFMGKDASKHP